MKRYAAVMDRGRWLFSQCAGARKVLDVGSWGSDPPHPSPVFRRLSTRLPSDTELIACDPAASQNDYGIAPRTLAEMAGVTCDVVLAGEVMEHIPDSAGFLADAARIAPRVCVTFPNPWGLLQMRQVLSGGVPRAYHDHIHWLCPATVANVAGRAGLEVKSVTPLTCSRGVRRIVAHAASSVLPSLCGSWGIELARMGLKEAAQRVRLP